MTRNEAIAAIKTALKRRSAKSWSVTGGRGTAYGWINIDVPPARRTWNWEGTGAETPGYGSQEERSELAKLLGLEKPVHPQGVNIPADSDYYQEYLDRAEGKPPSVRGKQYWD